MKELVLALSEIGPQHKALVGGKGANLAELAKGLTVPPAFCLTTDAYRRHLAQQGIQEKIKELLKDLSVENFPQIEEISQVIRNLILALPLLPEAQEAIVYAAKQLQTDRSGTLLAVRSSGTAEDQKDASFAGQQETFLNIGSPEQLCQAVKKCWASLWTPRAIHYRAVRGYSQEKVAMAVIIQEMIPAEISGVMFTANPVNNSRRELLIEVVRGLGEALVSGQVTGQRYILAKEGLRILSSPPGEALLPEAALRELALTGVKIEEFYQDYQDVEWAYYRGKFYFLQSRPITTLGDEPPQPLDWSRLNPIQRQIAQWVAERFPEPIYPLDGIVAKTYFMANFRAMEGLGFHVPDVDWSKVEKGLFPEYFVPPAVTRNYKQILNLLRLPKTLASDPVKDWHREQKNMLKIVDRMLTLDINIYPPNILFEYIEDALADFYSFVIWRYEYFIKNRLPSDILTFILKMVLGERAEKFKEDLLAGIPCTTLEINTRLEELAYLVQGFPRLAETLAQQENPSPEILREVPGGEEFLKALDSFLVAFGDRETTMGLGGLANPTWKEAPEVVLGIVRSILTGEKGKDTRASLACQRQEAAQKELAAVLSRGIWALLPLKPLVFALVRYNRNFAVFRENSHYHITKGLNTIKGLFLEVGRRFVRQGILKNERDIIYLTYFEMRDLIYKIYNYQKIDKAEVKELIDRRKLEQEKRFRQWETYKALVERPVQEGLAGIAASGGVVSGPARIIRDPREFHKLKKGDILVAPYTNPAWTPLFATAAGLVVDTGGAASHAAIIAREYGIPAVMGTGNATRVLKDGEKIVVNGSTGQIFRESSG